MSDYMYVAEAFIGIGFMSFLLLLTWFAYRIMLPAIDRTRIDRRIALLEIELLSRVCLKNGIDIEKIISFDELREKKSFKEELQEELKKEFFKEKKIVTSSKKE